MTATACGTMPDPDGSGGGGGGTSPSRPTGGGFGATGGGTGGMATGGGSSSAGGAGGGSAAGGSASRREELYTSGSRLRVRSYVGDDGSRQQVGLYDTQLQTLCAFTRAADGELRCLPLGGFTAYFGDAQCLQRVLSVPPSNCATTARFVMVPAETCPARSEVFTVTPTKVARAYVRSSAACTEVQLPGWEHFVVGAAVSPTMFMRGVEATE